MSGNQDFVHLHVHTEFSLLDGFSRINKLVDRVKELGMPSVAITDHGAMFGVIDFYRAAKAAGVKPIIGMEAYLTKRGRSRFDKEAGIDTKPYHMLLLAKNQTGYKNLLKIASASQLDGYYYRPRIDHEFMAAHSEGLIATSGCLAAEIPRLVERGQDEEAKRTIGWYQDVFGAENFFLELQHHNIPELHALNRWLKSNQDFANVPFVATNDVHYVLEDDYDTHDTLLCVQTGSVKAEQNRLRFESPTFHLRTQQEMWNLFGEVPESLTNTLRVAEMCEVNLDSDGYHLPVFPVPEGYNAETYLRYLCERGLEWRYGSHASDPDVVERLDYELGIIHKMGFDTYFLIVWDLCEFARHRDIWWNVRGSGAGSVAAYTLGITNIEPMSNQLIFERFLNPGRVSMPDIDLDYPEDRRAEMIQYCAEKYGEDKVAAIITFGTMGSKAALRDVGRAFDMPLTEVDRIARLIPTGGKPIKFKDALGDDPEKALPDLKEVYQHDPNARRLIDSAWALEGITRHASTHAAGVIVADKPLVEYIPLHRPTKGSGDDAPVKRVTQFSMETCESLGLLKVDFLGLSTLTIMRRACEMIEDNHGIHYDLSNIPYRPDPDDPEQSRMVETMFEMLGRGETIGVFQLESQGMRRMLTDMRPNRFEHIVAGISLYRPGPMDYIPTFNRRLHGEEEVQYKHPKLQKILEETYGICVSGDSIITDVYTGQCYRVDEIADRVNEIAVQGVDDDLNLAVGRVTHWICNGEKPVYRVTLRNGATIKTTHDHQFLTEEGWQPLNALAIGDFVATPPQLVEPTVTQLYDREKLRILACLIADGSLASGSSVDFVNKTPALIHAYLDSLETFDDLEPVYTQQVRTVTRIGVRSKRYKEVNSLLAWLRDLGLKYPPGTQYPCGVRSHEKSIPAFIFQLNNEDIAFFLAALWDCDGYVGEKFWHYKTVSPQLANDVQTLLLRLCIPSTIYTSEYKHNRNGGGIRSAYQVTVYEAAQLMDLLGPYMVSDKTQVDCGASIGHTTIERKRFVEEVQYSTSFSGRKLMARYGIDRQHFYAKALENRPRISTHVVAPVAEALELPTTRRLLNTHWTEIVAIEPAGTETVYDLTVEGIHNFVANNIVVHNCVYQEQIMQIGAELFGYSLGEADLMRRAVSKKKKKALDEHRKIFQERGPDHGVDADSANAIFDDIEFFARYGFNKCVTGDTEVIDAATGRLIRVGDLGDGTATIEHTVTLDTETLKLDAGPVTHAMQNGVKPVYRLTTQLGRTITATDNHPFYTFEGWRLLGELQTGEQIAVPRRIPVEGRKTWPEYKAIVLGHLIAEGNLCHPHGAYYYTQSDEQLADYTANLDVFENTESSISVHKGSYSVYSRRTDRHQPNGVVEWLKEIGAWGKGAHEKDIPDAAFELNNRLLGLMISRMWEGDGHINEKGRSLYYATASPRLAHQLQHLLLRFGIISRLRQVEFPYKDGRIGYQVFVTGFESIQLFAEHIGCHFVSAERRAILDRILTLGAEKLFGTKDIVPVDVKQIVRKHKDESGLTWEQLRQQTGVAPREFYATSTATKSGFTRATIGRLADFFECDELRSYSESDVYWDKIVSIEYVGEEMTYDLTVPDTHNFVANDIIVHNSHAADYAVLTCQTAFLKCHYPHEFMAALMSVHRDDSAKVGLFAADCHRMGIEILPPTVNNAQLDFSIEHLDDGTSAIRFGMGAIKNVGEGPLLHILEQRAEGGRFKDLDDYCRRVDARTVNKRATESLIKVGAMDEFAPRPSLLAALDRIVSFSVDHHKAQDVGQLSLFGEATGVDFGAEESILGQLHDVDPVPKREMLNWEKELVGLYVTDHPLHDIWDDLSYTITHTAAELIETGEMAQDQEVRVAGLITGVRRVITKRGDAMAILTIEDITATISAVLFPRTWSKYLEWVDEDIVVIVRGKADASRGDMQVIVDELTQQFDKVAAVADLTLPAPPAFSWVDDDPADLLDDDADDESEDVSGGERYGDPAITHASATAEKLNHNGLYENGLDENGVDDGDDDLFEDDEDSLYDDTGELKPARDTTGDDAPTANTEPVVPASMGAGAYTAPPIEPPSAPVVSPPPAARPAPQSAPPIDDREMPPWLGDDYDAYVPIPEWETSYQAPPRPAAQAPVPVEVPPAPNGSRTRTATPPPRDLRPRENGARAEVSREHERDHARDHAHDHDEFRVRRPVRREKPEPLPQPDPRMLTLTLHRTSDAAKDRGRMRRLHGMLTQYPGNDRFRFVLVDPQRTAQLDFPNHSIGINDEMLNYVARLVGSENISIEDL